MDRIIRFVVSSLRGALTLVAMELWLFRRRVLDCATFGGSIVVSNELSSLACKGSVSPSSSLPLLGDLGGRPVLGLFLPALGDLLVLGDRPGAGGGTPGKSSSMVAGTPGNPSDAAARNGGGLGPLVGFPAETALRI